MGVLEVDRGLVSDRGSPATAVIEVFDLAGDLTSSLITGLPRPSVVELGLERRPERLGHRVVEAHASATHRLVNSQHLTHLVELVPGELGPPIRVEHNPLRNLTPSALAMRRARSIRSVVCVESISQPSRCREQPSRTARRYSQTSPVHRYVMSDIHTRLSSPVSKSRLTRSGIQCVGFSGMVVTGTRDRGEILSIPSRRIALATVFQSTEILSSCRSMLIRGAPKVWPEALQNFNIFSSSSLRNSSRGSIPLAFFSCWPDRL